jgi:hypothetical protein
MNQGGTTMAFEISVTSRSLLFAAKKAQSVKEMEKAIEALCSKDDINAVNQSLRELEEYNENKK